MSASDCLCCLCRVFIVSDGPIKLALDKDNTPADALQYGARFKENKALLYSFIQYTKFILDVGKRCLLLNWNSGMRAMQYINSYLAKRRSKKWHASVLQFMSNLRLHAACRSLQSGHREAQRLTWHTKVSACAQFAIYIY